MKIPLPQNISQQISQKAAQYARESVQNMGWSNKSIQAINPLPGDDGSVGLSLSEKYLVPQSRGFDPFLMTWVEGRVVPLKDGKTGQTSYRYGRGVGEPGWVTLPGGVRKYREQKWRHPGSRPKRFLENAITRAINEAKPTIVQQLRRQLMGE